MREIEQLVSKKIRDTRKGRGMTLKELSAQTGLSASFLSQVERGVSSVALTSLRSISRGLGVSMNELISVENSNAYINRSESQMLTRLGKNYKGFVRLSGKFPSRVLECFMLILDPHTQGTEMTQHEGEEFYYVVRGTAVFILDNEEYVVDEGESIHYPSHVRHTLDNREDTELNVICVITPPMF